VNDEPTTPPPQSRRPDYFDDDTYDGDAYRAPSPPRSSGRRPPPPGARPTPWPMIIGVALLAVLAVVMAFIVFGGDGGSPDGSPSPTPSASAASSAAASAGPSASAAASEAPSASASAGATPTPVSIDLDSIVATTVSDLSVRAGPTTSATKLGSLENGALSFVAGGPVDADGYRWYLVSGLGLPPSTGCTGPFETDPFNCPIWFGWVASASPSGAAWLAPHAIDCAATPIDFEEIVIGVTDLMRLSCFGADPFTFRAFWPEIPDDAGLGGACVSQDEPSGWLVCQNINYNGLVIDEEQGFGGLGLHVSIDPASGVSMPERGTWVELTVHLDDPAAQACDDTTLAQDGDEPPEQWVLSCRGQMVVESVSAVDGP
jgi:hypothetical protein